MDKQLIAERFAKARNTYGREARVQQQVAEKMLHLLTEYAVRSNRTALNTLATPGNLAAANALAFSPRFRHIVEFGCGTGCYSRLLLQALQPQTLLLNDLCHEMEECIKDVCPSAPLQVTEQQPALSPPTAVHFSPGDAEQMDFPQGTDLITSCSTLQWFSHPESFFLRCHRFLADDGILAFSTFGKKNMQEIRRLTGNGLDYLPLAELHSLLSPRFDLLYASEELVSLPFSTPLQVLQHLKQTGVTGTEKKMWTRGRLQDFCNNYVRHFSDANRQVLLTYHPIYIIAKKK